MWKFQNRWRQGRSPGTPHYKPRFQAKGPVPDRTNSAHVGIGSVGFRCRPDGKLAHVARGAQALCCRPGNGSARRE